MRTIKTFIPIAAAAACLLATAPSASAACAGSTSAPYAAAVTSTPGLVSYWRLGESSGTNACDSFAAIADVAGPSFGDSGLKPRAAYRRVGDVLPVVRACPGARRR